MVDLNEAQKSATRGMSKPAGMLIGDAEIREEARDHSALNLEPSTPACQPAVPAGGREGARVIRCQ